VDDSQARLTALYEEHYRSVLSYVLLRADQETAEDITSETFVIAWRKLSRLPEPPLPWLLGVARNLVRTQRRTSARRHNLVARLAELAPADDVAEQVAERQAALTALAELSELDAEAVLLASWYGLTPDEAAKIAGCSARTFNVRLHRARRRLTDALNLTQPTFLEQS
jgi:RNA polymerase sigma factor (sigma-70 family)